MHGEPAQVIADDLDLTGVDSGADLEVELLSGPQGDASTAPDPASVGSLRLRPSSRMLPDGSSEILPEQTAQRTRCPVFHIVARRTPLRWDAIHGLVLSHELPLITSENRPADVAPGNWCKYILARRLETGRDVADAVIRALTGDRDEPAAMAMIDELAGGRGLVPKIADAARRLRRRRPDLRGRWGAFVGSGPRTAYTKFNPPEAPAIDELLRADATLTLELYPRYSAYCASAATVSGRVQWMAVFFRGGGGAFPQPRLRWLAERRQALGSASRLTVLFPTTDVSPLNYLPRTGAATYLDRMFYVWANHSGFRGMMLAGNGGIGTYKWDGAVLHRLRDTRFVECWNHYCRDGARTTMRGRPDCG